MGNDRNSVWHSVWDNRDDYQVDWNGYESCFDSQERYEEWMRHIASMLRTQLRLTDDDVVVDLGCGTGRFATLIAPYVKQVLAFDYAAAPIAFANSRRPARNVTYQVADITTLKPRNLGATKAYSVGCLFYLNSIESAYGVIRQSVETGIPFAAIDLPDGEIQLPKREYSYDTSVYSHLSFNAHQLEAQFSGTKIVRDDYLEYINSKYRFHAFIPSSVWSCQDSIDTN